MPELLRKKIQEILPKHQDALKYGIQLVSEVFERGKFNSGIISHIISFTSNEELNKLYSSILNLFGLCRRRQLKAADELLNKLKEAKKVLPKRGIIKYHTNNKVATPIIRNLKTPHDVAKLSYASEDNATILTSATLDTVQEAQIIENIPQ